MNQDQIEEHGLLTDEELDLEEEDDWDDDDEFDEYYDELDPIHDNSDVSESLGRAASGEEINDRIDDIKTSLRERRKRLRKHQDLLDELSDLGLEEDSLGAGISLGGGRKGQKLTFEQILTLRMLGLDQEKSPPDELAEALRYSQVQETLDRREEKSRERHEMAQLRRMEKKLDIASKKMEMQVQKAASLRALTQPEESDAERALKRRLEDLERKEEERKQKEMDELRAQIDDLKRNPHNEQYQQWLATQNNPFAFMGQYQEQIGKITEGMKVIFPWFDPGGPPAPPQGGNVIGRFFDGMANMVDKAAANPNVREAVATMMPWNRPPGEDPHTAPPSSHGHGSQIENRFEYSSIWIDYETGKYGDLDSEQEERIQQEKQCEHVSPTHAEQIRSMSFENIIGAIENDLMSEDQLEEFAELQRILLVPLPHETEVHPGPEGGPIHQRLLTGDFPVYEMEPEPDIHPNAELAETQPYNPPEKIVDGQEEVVKEPVTTVRLKGMDDADLAELLGEPWDTEEFEQVVAEDIENRPWTEEE